MTSTESANAKIPLAWGRRFWAAVALISSALIVVWILIPWQWSPVDDPGQVLTMKDLTSHSGLFGGVLERVGQLAAGDREGGVFRPLAWVYPPVVYSLPVTAAHLLRLAMLIVIILGPLVYFRRRGSRPLILLMTLVLLLISAGTLYEGLLLLSIQEVGGMALVSLGLMADQRILRLLLWTLSSLFKGPFLWILFGYAIVLWREGRKKLAAASASLGLAVLLINVWWSRSGSYTSGYQLSPLDPYQWINASKLLEPINGAILLAVLWWLVVTQSRLTRRPDFPIFAFAAIGYFVQMVPWGFTAYYMGPISFFMGLLLASVLTDTARVSRWAITVGLALPILLAVWVMQASLGFVYRTNALIQQSSECLAETTNARTEIVGGWLYLASSDEGPIRLRQNTELFYPGWIGDVTLDSTSTGDPRDPKTTHLLLLPGASASETEADGIVCTRRYVSLSLLK